MKVYAEPPAGRGRANNTRGIAGPSPSIYKQYKDNLNKGVRKELRELERRAVRED